MDNALSHFTIDDHLKRYKKALVHLSQSSTTFDEVLLYVKKHELHREAMELYKEQREQYDVQTISAVLI
jgi:elongator complex protein 1